MAHWALALVSTMQTPILLRCVYLEQPLNCGFVAYTKKIPIGKQPVEKHTYKTFCILLYFPAAISMLSLSYTVVVYNECTMNLYMISINRHKFLGCHTIFPILITSLSNSRDAC